MNSVGINGLNRSYGTNLLYGESSGDLFLISRLLFYAVNKFNTGDDIGQQITTGSPGYLSQAQYPGPQTARDRRDRLSAVRPS